MDFMLNEREYHDLKEIIQSKNSLSLHQIIDLLFFARKIKMLNDSYRISLQEGRSMPGELENVMCANINEMDGILEKMLYLIEAHKVRLSSFLESVDVEMLAGRHYVVCWGDEENLSECLLYTEDEAEKVLQQIRLDTHFSNKNMQLRRIESKEAETIIRTTLARVTGEN